MATLDGQDIDDTLTGPELPPVPSTHEPDERALQYIICSTIVILLCPGVISLDLNHLIILCITRSGPQQHKSTSI